GHSVVLFADPDLLQEARVMVSAARLVEALPRAAAEPDSVELPPEAARVFNLPTVVPRRDVAAAVSRREFFMRETDGGAATAAMAEHVHATRAEALVRAELRWIQVLVYEGTGAERQERRQALRPNTVHSMDVWVG